MTALAARLPTADRIRLAALVRFGRMGVGATAIRAIIRDADVNLNALHYHFGSKEELLRAVFQEAMAPIEAERERGFAALADAAAPSVRDVLEAMYGPILRRAAAPLDADVSALAFLVQLRRDPAPEATALLDEHQATIAPRFESLLARALGAGLADAPGPALALAIRLVNSAAWDLAGQPRLVADATRGQGSVSALLDRFMTFSVAGLTASIHESPEPPP